MNEGLSSSKRSSLPALRMRRKRKVPSRAAQMMTSASSSSAVTVKTGGAMRRRTMKLRLALAHPDLGADSRFDTVEGEITRTFSQGRNTYQLGLIYATTLESDGAVQDYFPLGGFLRLSGLERGEISGPHAALARLVYYRRIGETTGLLDTPIYFGFSAEAGNAWQNRSEMDFDTMLLNASLFAGLDTFIGPVYFAAGFAEGGGSNFYLFIGEPPRADGPAHARSAPPGRRRARRQRQNRPRRTRHRRPPRPAGPPAPRAGGAPTPLGITCLSPPAAPRGP